jgi:tetratricopeptide (TPR) repeat protein
MANRKDYDGASEILDRLKTVNPKSPWEPYARGVLMYLQQNISEAIVQFNRAKTLDPSFTYAYANLGYIYYNERKYEEAIEHFRQASVTDGKNPEYPFNMDGLLLKTETEFWHQDILTKLRQLKLPMFTQQWKKH